MKQPSCLFPAFYVQIWNAHFSALIIWVRWDFLPEKTKIFIDHFIFKKIKWKSLPYPGPTGNALTTLLFCKDLSKKLENLGLAVNV